LDVPTMLALVQGFLAAPRGQATLEQVIAWEDFYHEFDPLVVRTSRTYGRGWNDGDDIHQEIWCELGKGLLTLKFDPAWGTLRHWVLKVSRRVRWRHTRRRPGRPDEEHDADLLASIVDAASQDDDEADLWRRLEQASEIVEGFAATLPKRNGQIVVKRWIDGRAGGQIADEVGVSEECVRSVLRRSRAKLRKLLVAGCTDQS
jgi:RNA polymerase sigma factor (sigma-70 family)